MESMKGQVKMYKKQAEDAENRAIAASRSKRDRSAEIERHVKQQNNGGGGGFGGGSGGGKGAPWGGGGSKKRNNGGGQAKKGGRGSRR